jgi:hypothetical protein
MFYVSRNLKAPLSSEMTYLIFILRRVVFVAIVAGSLCVLTLLFALPFLFMKFAN